MAIGEEPKVSGEEPKVSLAGVALAEFTALRGEVQSIRQIQTAVYTAGLTILSAVGGFALAKKEGRLEMLLVLPLVLSGLGLILVESEIGVSNIGEYIREDLSKRLPTDDRRSSWEMFIHRARNPWYSVLGAAAPGLILVVPSVASLGVTWHRKHHLWPLWWGGAVAVAIFIVAFTAHSIHVLRARKGGKPSSS